MERGPGRTEQTHPLDVVRSLTVLTLQIGYDNAAKAAKYADGHDISLQEAVIALGLLTYSEFDAAADPRKMLFPFSGNPG